MKSKAVILLASPDDTVTLSPKVRFGNRVFRAMGDRQAEREFTAAMFNDFARQGNQSEIQQRLMSAQTNQGNMLLFGNQAGAICGGLGLGFPGLK